MRKTTTSMLFFALLVCGLMACNRRNMLKETPLAHKAVTLLDSTDKVLIGAIRWDAWFGDYGYVPGGPPTVGMEVERSLSPNEYHYRAPFYSVEISADSIQCRGNTQAIMDEEIQYAKDAGIDYWAFCWYRPHTGLDTARTLYLASSHKDDVKWCVILGTATLTLNTDAPWLVQRFKESNYQKVAGGRPLIYVYQTGVPKVVVDSLRSMCSAQGVPAPYIAVMDFTASTAKTTALNLGADALSSYKSTVGSNGQPYYPVLPKGDSTGWEQYKNADTSLKIIPWVTSGRNTKPRIDNPVSWTTVPPSAWVADGTPQQIANDLAKAFSWVGQHKSACEANTIIIYAWNEFDEGGWICPTFGNNTVRLDSIKNVIQNQ